MKVQYAIKNGDIYVLEVNPRALARTVPFVARCSGLPGGQDRGPIMAGEPLASFGLSPKPLHHIGRQGGGVPPSRASPASTCCSAPRCAPPAR
jgi:carbamoyl-phosphate synthase large subunit